MRRDWLSAVWFTIVVLVVVFLAFELAPYSQRPVVNPSGSTTNRNQNNSGQQVLPPVDSSNQPNSTQGSGQQQTQNQAMDREAIAADRQARYAMIQTILAGVGLAITLVLLYYTQVSLKLTRRQLKLTRDSNEVVARLNQQWLDGRVRCRLEGTKGSEKLVLQFIVINPTSMAVTFHRASYFLVGWPAMDVGDTEVRGPEIDEHRVLPPSGEYPLDTGYYELNTEERLTAYNEGLLQIMLICWASYTDAFNHKRDQEIGRLGRLQRGRSPKFSRVDIGAQHHPDQPSWFEQMRKKYPNPGAEDQGQHER